MTNAKPTIAVLGAGISGLTAAYRLQQLGCHVRVFEKDSGPGGVIRTTESDGWRVEQGPNTLLVRSETIWQLIDELDLEDELVEANDKAVKRYIVRNEKLHPLPQSAGSFLTTPLLSARAKIRLLGEPFIRPGSQEDESIASFFERRLGPEPVAYAVDPFVSGIYAGTPGELSVKHTFPSLFAMEREHGSLFKGAMKSRKHNAESPNPKKALVSFHSGLQALPKALHHRLEGKIRYNSGVTGILQNADGWEIQADGEAATFDAVISTLPAHGLSGLESGPDALGSLSDITYAPLSVVALGFKREQVGHPLDGFGVLIPESEPFYHLGTLFSSTLFPGRAPEGHVLLTSFIGGRRDPQQARKKSGELLTQLIPELSRLLEIEGAPHFTRHYFWKRAIPQYRVGYGKHLETIENLEEAYPGLFIGGNIRGGVSVPDCITSSIETAEKASLFLQS